MIPYLCIVLLFSIRLISSQTSSYSGVVYGPTIRYSYTGSLQPYVVPSAVYAISVSLAGGCGMYNGGRGNILNATIVTSPLDTLYISVAGGFSNRNGTTVIGGGGAGYGTTSTGGMAAGGGSTDVRGSCKTIQCTLAIAAGGGGGGYDSLHGYMYRGGDAGYPSGSSGGAYTIGASYAGQGGMQGVGGAFSVPASVAASGLSPTSFPFGSFMIGSLGQGGYACNYTFKSYNNKHPNGGGGGGGYYGGGGGCNAGGGGGSSYCSYLCSDLSLGLVPYAPYCNPQGYALITPIYNVPNIITTYAGTGYNVNNGLRSGDGDVATSASFGYPFGVAVDSTGNVYISDTSQMTVRMVAKSTGIITAFVGTNAIGSTGDMGPASLALLKNPQGLAVDSSGNLFIVDMGNNKIRMVTYTTISGTTTSGNIISTYAGTGILGTVGDGGPATSAQISPTSVGLAVDIQGNVYLAEANGVHRVRMINRKTGIIRTIVGSSSGVSGAFGDGGLAQNALLSTPSSLAIDRNMNLFITEVGTGRIRMVTNGTNIITTIAGNTDSHSSPNGNYQTQPATSANLLGMLRENSGLAVDFGHVYVVDQSDNKVWVVNRFTGTLVAYAGTGSGGAGSNNYAATASELFTPVGLAIDTTGNLYIADSSTFRVRQVSPSCNGIGVPGTIGNGFCDANNNNNYNNVGCNYDGGDCCPQSCISTKTYVCGSGGYNCQDPRYGGPTFRPTPAPFNPTNYPVQVPTSDNSPVQFSPIPGAPTNTPNAPTPLPGYPTLVPTSPRPSYMSASTTFTTTVQADITTGAGDNGPFRQRFVAAILIYLPAGSNVNINSIVTSSAPTSSSTTSVTSTSITRRMVSSGASRSTTRITNAGTTHAITADTTTSNTVVHTDNGRRLLRQLLTSTFLTISFTVAAYVGSIASLTSMVQNSDTIAKVATTLNQYYQGMTIATPTWVANSPSPGCTNNCGGYSNNNNNNNNNSGAGPAIGGGALGGIIVIVSIILYCRFRKGRPCCDEFNYFGNEQCKECCQDCCICCKGSKYHSGQVYAASTISEGQMGHPEGGSLVDAPAKSSVIVDEPLPLSVTTSQQGPGPGPGLSDKREVESRGSTGEGQEWPIASVKSHNSNNNSINNSTTNSLNHKNSLPTFSVSTMNGSTATHITTSNHNLGGSLGSTSSMGQRINVTGGQFLPTIDWNDISPTVKIGAGAFSAVYRGTWKRGFDLYGHPFAVEVALKVMTKSRSQAGSYRLARDNARKEAELVYGLCLTDDLAKYVTEVYGWAEGPLPSAVVAKVNLPPGDEGFCMVLKYEAGGSLEGVLHQFPRRHLSMIDKLQLLAQMAHIVAALHKVGAIHGDLKPANFLLTDTTSLVIKIADFGMSQITMSSMTESSLGQSALHQTGGTKGTPIYCAPEMLVPDEDTESVIGASRATDAYALAVIAHEVLCQKRPFDQIKNAAQLGVRVARDGLRPPLDKLPSDTPPAVVDMMVLCWDADRTKRQPAARFFETLANELDMLEELEEQRGMGGFGQGGRNRMGQTMMVSVQQMLAELKQGQLDLKEGQQQIMHSIQELNVQLTTSLTGLGQSLSDLGAIALTDPKAEHGIELIANALQAHRMYLSSSQPGGESSSEAQTALLRAITEATAALQPDLAMQLQRSIVDVMTTSHPLPHESTGSTGTASHHDHHGVASDPSPSDKLDVLLDVVRDLQSELKGVKALAQEQTSLLQVLEKRTNRMPHTFVVIPDTGGDTNMDDPSNPTTTSIKGKMTGFLIRQKNKLLGLAWDRSRLYFICPISGSVVKCGPQGKGYPLNIPTALLKAVAPALKWGVVFLKVALATQGLGGVVPIPLDWLPSQLNNSEERLLSVVGQMAKGLNLPEDVMTETADTVDGQVFNGANTAVGAVKTIDPRARQQTEHMIDHLHGPREVDPLTANALARVFKFVAEAEGHADNVMNPMWTPEHVGLVLAKSKTGTSCWVSRENVKVFEERGWEAVQKKYRYQI